MKKLSILLSSAALALALVSQVEATSVTLGGIAVAGEGMETSVAGAKTMTFDGMTTLPAGFAAIGTTPTNPLVISSVTNQYLAPTGDTSNYLTTGTGTIVDLAIPTGSTYFGFYWGSVDTYNLFEIKESNGTTFDLSGGKLASLFPASPVNGSNSYFVNLYADQGTTFTSAGFSSSTNAFEFDNVTTATPEPATIAMLAGGLLIVAGAVRRGRRKA